jgi:broad specificity phosphatase PhoE
MASPRHPEVAAQRPSKDDRPIPPPKLYYVRHGLTDWNVEGRLQGGRDVPLNERGRRQAAVCAGILGDLLKREERAASDYDYVSSPLVRASETMEIMRLALDLPRDGYGIEPRLAEIAFGTWEGLTYNEILGRDANVVATREHNKWDFRSPEGETYAEVAVRVAAWHATLTRDTVVCAHGGTARALVAVLGVAPPEKAVHYPIEQGVVYLFKSASVRRYA